jgi:hypothetical protein
MLLRGSIPPTAIITMAKTAHFRIDIPHGVKSDHFLLATAWNRAVSELACIHLNQKLI